MPVLPADEFPGDAGGFIKQTKRMHRDAQPAKQG